MKTFMAKAGEVQKKWYVVDAEGQVLGRLATKVAVKLRGKDKPQYTPHMDIGDYVIIVNAEKIMLTGNKENQKLYRHHSLYPGGLKEVKYKEMLKKKPERIIELAIKGMLPKNSLGRQLFRNLKVYKGSEHPHQAQQPEVLNIED